MAASYAGASVRIVDTQWRWPDREIPEILNEIPEAHASQHIITVRLSMSKLA